MIQAEIVEKPSLLVVGREAAFIHALSPDANNLEVIGKLWNKFVHQAREIPHRVGSEMYGIIYALPPSQRSHPDQLQYIAAVAVSGADDLASDLTSRDIPAATYAVATHRGPVAGIGETVGQLYRWLSESPYQHSGIVDVELYDHRFNPTAEDSVMEYWVSVQPRA